MRTLVIALEDTIFVSSLYVVLVLRTSTAVYNIQSGTPVKKADSTNALNAQRIRIAVEARCVLLTITPIFVELLPLLQRRLVPAASLSSFLMEVVVEVSVV